MTRIWNYFFYCTKRLLEVLGDYLIVRPLVYIAGFVPLFRRNWKKGKKYYFKLMDWRNIRGAFSLMLFTTTVAYGSIYYSLEYYFEITVNDNSKSHIFIVIMVLTIITNYTLLWQSDVYKIYFRKFDMTHRKRVNYLHAVLFHLVGWLGFIIYLIKMGFDF